MYLQSQYTSAFPKFIDEPSLSLQNFLIFTPYSSNYFPPIAIADYKLLP